MKRFGRNSVSLAPGVTVRDDGCGSLEHLGSWSNTGYLELDLAPPESEEEDNEAENEARGDTPVLQGWKMVVKAINSKEHLAGIKRARGGLGSSRHDEAQKSIDFFFKKQKTT